MTLSKTFLALTFIFGVFSFQSAAAPSDWIIDPANSKVTFQYQRGGQPADGIFATFTGSGTFDPDNPQSAVMSIRIDAGSIDLFDRLASTFALSGEWFNTSMYRHVTYQLKELTPAGGDRYVAIGALTIRGKTLPIKSEIVLNIGESQAKATGRLELQRASYDLGVGLSTTFVEIGPKVAVVFDLVATPSR